MIRSISESVGRNMLESSSWVKEEWNTRFLLFVINKRREQKMLQKCFFDHVESPAFHVQLPFCYFNIISGLTKKTSMQE